MASSTTETSKKVRKRAKLYLASVAIGIVTVLLAVDLSGFGGNIIFYSKWISCGQRPVMNNPNPDFGNRAQEYAESPTVMPFRLSHDYYCTPLDAELAGYSASEDDYYFPHLDRQPLEVQSQRKNLSEMNEESDKATMQQLTVATTIFIVGGITTTVLYYKSRKIKV